MFNPEWLFLIDKTKVWYLASPYSSTDPEMVHKRYKAVNKAGAILCKEGFILIEPIAMCHHKSLEFDLPQGYEYWKTRDRKFVSMSDGILVLQLPGWIESTGVTDEVAYAQSLGKPVMYLTANTFLDKNELEELL